MGVTEEHVVVNYGEKYAEGAYVSPQGFPFFDWAELRNWHFYRAAAVEFGGTLVLLYISMSVLISNKESMGTAGIGILGTSWSFGGTLFVIVYCTGGISGGHVNPAITFGLLLTKRLTFPCFLLYSIAQCLGGITGVALVKLREKSFFNKYEGGANVVQPGYTVGDALLAEIVGTFILMFTVSSALDPKRKARDSHVPMLTPLPIGFAGFVIHLATIPVDGCGINPARSLGPAVIYNSKRVWDDQWIFWVGPIIGATLGAFAHYASSWFHPKKLMRSSYGDSSDPSNSTSTSDKRPRVPV